jgi:hypothetical protein
VDFRVEHEIKVIRKVVKHVRGPCLFCDREIEYENRVTKLGMQWLQKQFESDARSRNVKALRLGIPPKARSMALLESLLCDTCQGRLPVIRQETAAEREKELRKRAEMSARYHAAVEADREREGHGWSQEADFS